MANFDANIDLIVNSSAALRGVQQVEKAFEKLNKQAAQFAEIFGSSKVDRALTNTVKQTVAIGRALRASKAAAAEFNAELIRTDRLLQSIQRSQQRALPAARASAGALPPARTAGLLPAAGGTGAASGSAPFERAAAQARAADQAAYSAATQASIKAANDLTRTIESEVAARRKAALAVEKVTTKTDRTAQKLLSPGVVPPSGGSASPLGVNTSATARKQQILQKEVDRQIRVMGKVSDEMLETVAKYNKLQDNTDKLVKTTGRLSTKLSKEAKKKNKGGGGGGGSGGMNSLSAGIGFPLLFGGGAGSIAGGAIGSLAGGFGEQILLSAIGGIIDSYVSSLDKLGKSLESTSGIIGGLEEAGYKVSGATKDVISSYQAAGLEAEAYQLAIEEINRILGPDGAAMLSAYRVESEALNQQFSDLKAELDSELIPALTGTIRLINVLGTALNNLPGEDFIKETFKNIAKNVPGAGGFVQGFEALQTLGGNDGTVTKPKSQLRAEQALEIEQRTKELELADKLVDAQNKISDAARQTKYVTDAQIEAARAGTDLANANVFAAREEVIERQYIVALQKAGVNEAAKKLALAQKELAILNLQNSRTSALSTNAKSAPKSKALQLEQQITQELLKQTDLTNKRIGLAQGSKAELTSRIALAQGKVDSEVKIVELQRQQALESNKVAGDVALINEKYDAQLQTLLLRNQLDKENYQQRLKALALEEKMAGVKAKRAVDDFTLDAQRQLKDISMQMANPFGGDELERMQLQAQQTREYADGVKELTRRIEDLNAQQELAPTDARAIEIQGVQSLLSKYRELTPAIFEAQQQQLQLNQTMEKLQPITNAIASGMSAAITGVIDGTKTVEEAMAEMFANIGKSFIDMATQMIAKALVMKALNIFMPGASNYGGVPGGRGPQYMGPAYAGGGYTGDAPRSGGVDGKGGFPAILHPQETVVDHYDDARNAMSTSAANSTAFAEAESAMAMASSNYVYNTTANSYSNSNSSSSSTTNGTGTSNSSSTTIQLQTQVINQVEYATVEEVNKGLQSTAKQTEANVYRNMRNRPATRNRVGV